MIKSSVSNINKYKLGNKALNEARDLIDDEQYEEAMKLARTAYKYNPESEDVIFTYAQALYFCGYEKKAASLLEKIETYEEPYYNGTGVYFYLSDCYRIGNCNLFKALKLINKAIKLCKENHMNCDNELVIKGQILYAMGYYDEILPILESLYKLKPTRTLEIYLSKTYFKKGDYLKGYLYFTKVFNYYEEMFPNLTQKEIQQYLDMRQYEDSKEYKSKINNRVKKTIEDKLSIHSLKDADVLIYSKKFAIGLKYEKTIKPVPFVVYRNDNVSEAKKEAERLSILAYENKFTNKIYRQTLFQDVIDREFYVPVAEALAKVHKAKKNNVHKRDKT